MRVPDRICKGLHYVGIGALTYVLHRGGVQELRHSLPGVGSDYSFGTQDSIEAGVACDAAELELVHQGTDLLQV
jgi:hypothetical protein